MIKQIRKKRSKLSKKKNNKPSQLKSINVNSAKTTQAKYNHLNMKVRDMVRALGIDSEKINFIDNPDKIKMSAVILKLSEPYIKMYWGNESQVRGIIALTIMVWNMSFLTQKEQNELQEMWIDEVLPDDCHAQDVTTMLNIFDYLQTRQRELFPNIKKFIMGHDLRLDNDNIHLDISSAPLKEKQTK